ncbi:MAG: 3-deoxy-7-phosphoheptulonate synthase [bacterium]|nr:3-deoxy-7-phosphoheptulonate synthase [bacterium]
MREAIEPELADREDALPSPRRARARVAGSKRTAQVVKRGRREIEAALRGRDPRLLVIVGPCSIHDRESALEYAHRLAKLARATRESLIIAMRTYFEKPRTTVGWKGLLNDPDLDGSCKIGRGLLLARQILAEVNELGLPCASEVLDPITPHYLGDLLSWAAIGARTSESQVHRELASGLAMPVGFKNGTGGALEIARDAIQAARSPHRSLGIDMEGRVARQRREGNPNGHLVLRGGASGPNHTGEHIERGAELVRELAGAPILERPILVDCSHDNSGKDPALQAQVCRAVVSADGPHPSLLGVLLESHLFEGRQDWRPDTRLEYGVSLTDPCLGWEQTEELILHLAEASASKPRRRAGTLATA